MSQDIEIRMIETRKQASWSPAPGSAAPRSIGSPKKKCTICGAEHIRITPWCSRGCARKAVSFEASSEEAI